MHKVGYKGISFPFRISNQGGVIMSTTSENDVAHIEESIKQILGTNYLERVMEPEIYSSVSTSLFEPNDATLQQIIKNDIVEALSALDDRIEVEESGITFEIVSEDYTEVLYATITYKVIKYQTYFSTTVKVGELDE